MPSISTAEFTFAEEWLAEPEESPAPEIVVYHLLAHAIRDKLIRRRSVSCDQWEDWVQLSPKGVKAAVHTAIYHKHKRQVKGTIIYANHVCDLASSVLLETQARLKKPSELLSKRLIDNSGTLQRILTKLELMLREEDEADFLNKPNKFAHDKFREFVKSAYTHHVGQSPDPAIAPDGDGGIVAEWKSGQNIVRLIVAPIETAKTYIYRKGIDRKGNPESAIDHSPSGLLLAQRLAAIFGD